MTVKTRSGERGGKRRHVGRGAAQAPAQAAGTVSAADLMLQKLDRLRHRLCKESKDVDELMALSEAIRIVRTYFGK